MSVSINILLALYFCVVASYNCVMVLFKLTVTKINEL